MEIDVCDLSSFLYVMIYELAGFSYPDSERRPDPTDTTESTNYTASVAGRGSKKRTLEPL
jgi:hypothetical protein